MGLRQGRAADSPPLQDPREEERGARCGEVKEGRRPPTRRPWGAGAPHAPAPSPSATTAAGGARRRRLRADESASRGSRPAPSPASADQVRAHKIHPQHLPDSALVSSYCARVSDFVTSRLPGGAASCCCAAATGVESACRKPRGRRRRGRRGLHTAGLKRRLRAATDPLHSAFSPGAWMRPPLPPLPPPPPPEHGEPSGPPEGGWNDGAGGATHCPLQG